MLYRLVPADTVSSRNAEGWRLDLPATIGRNPDHGVSIDDISISRAHCQILLGPDEGLQIRDLGSTNGTYVNGERIQKIHSIVPGDILQLGSVSLRIEYSSDTDPGLQIKKKPSSTHVKTTQPMKTIPPTFTVMEVKPVAKRWWEFWKE